MGLDITAYSQLKELKGLVFDQYQNPIDPITMEEIHNTVQLYFNKDFNRHDNLKDGQYYGYEDAYSFRAGSYGGYSRWRNQLAQLAGWKDDREAWDSQEGKFWELIYFSDCEGVIGPETSKKILKDFEEYYELASLEDEVFFDKYMDWKKAFELAADGGAVDFH